MNNKSVLVNYQNIVRMVVHKDILQDDWLTIEVNKDGKWVDEASFLIKEINIMYSNKDIWNKFDEIINELVIV